MSSFSSLLRTVAIVVLLLLATSNFHQYAEALESEEYQRAQLVGGAVGRHSTRHLRNGQTRNMGSEGTKQQQHFQGAEYIPGRRLGKTLHIDLHNEQHEAA